MFKVGDVLKDTRDGEIVKLISVGNVDYELETIQSGIENEYELLVKRPGETYRSHHNIIHRNYVLDETYKVSKILERYGDI